jgi:K+/H+ antiporter YhaU regulatory subunit KhtT
MKEVNMKFLDKVRESVKQSSEKLSETTKRVIKKGKETGEEGVEVTKEYLSQIGEKASEVTSVVKLKFEIKNFQKRFDLETLTLGKLVFDRFRSRTPLQIDESIKLRLDKLEELENQIHSKNSDYEELRKEISDDYVISKLSDDLAASGAVIDLVRISENSNVIDKQVKELLLPKDALISALKRGSEVIIPDGTTKLHAGDQVTIIGKIDDVERVAKRLTAD